MTLVEKVQELQAIRPPLDPTEIKKRIEEWKSQTNYKAPEPVEVKTQGAAEKSGSVAPTTNTPPKNPFSNSLSSSGQSSSFNDNFFINAYNELAKNNTLLKPIDPEETEEEKSAFEAMEDDIYTPQELPQVVLQTIYPRLSINNMANALGFDIFSDTSDKLEEMNLQKKFSEFANKTNTTTIQDQIDLGNIKETSETGVSKFLTGVKQRDENQNLFYNPGFLGKFGAGLSSLFYNYRGASLDDISKLSLQATNGQPVLGLNYEKGIKVDGFSQPLTQAQIKTKIKELEREFVTPDSAKEIDNLRKALTENGGNNLRLYNVEQAQSIVLNNKIDESLGEFDQETYSKKADEILSLGQNHLNNFEQRVFKAQQKIKKGDFDNEEQKEILQYFVDNGTFPKGKLYNFDTDKFTDIPDAPGVQTVSAETLSKFTGLSSPDLGNDLYDEEGDLIQFDIKVPVNDESVYSVALDKAETTELDVLKNEYVRTHQGVIELAKGTLQLNNNKIKASEVPVDNIEDIKESLLSEDEVNYLNYIVENGKLPKDLKFLDGSTTIKKKFNTKLREYQVLNTALVINKNILTSKDKQYIPEFINAVADDKIFTLNEAQTLQGNLFKSVGLSEYSSGWGEFNYNLGTYDKNIGQNIFAGIPHLAQWGIEIAVFRRLSGNSVNKLFTGLNYISQAYFKGNKYMAAGARWALKGGEEALEFGGAAALKQLITGKEQDIKGSLYAGGTMGFGGAAGRQVISKFQKYIRPQFAKTPLYYLQDTPVWRNFTRNAASAAGGATAYISGGILMDPLNYEYEKTLETFITEFGKMYALRGITTSLKAPTGSMRQLVRDWSNTILQMKDLSYNSKKALGVLGIDESLVRDPKINSNQQVAKSAQDAVNKINKDLADGNITSEEAVKKIKQISESKLSLDNQIAVNQAKRQLEKDRETGQAPTRAEEVKTLDKLKNGENLTALDSSTISKLPPELIAQSLGIEPNSGAMSQLNELINREIKIQKIMDGGEGSIILTNNIEYVPASTFKVARSNTKLRNEVYDFLNKKLDLDSSIQRLEAQDTKGMSPLEKNALKKEIETLTKELESYMEGGETAVEIQKKIDAAAATELSKQKRLDIQQEENFPLVTSKGEVTSEYLTNDEFVERLKQDGIEATSEDVAVTLSDGTIVYNESKMKNIKDFSTAAHEKVGHAIFFDTFKDAEGLVTEDGIKFINDMLNLLPTSIREQVKAEVESRYDTSKPENEWYEENLGVMAEFMKDGKIKYKKSIGEQIREIVPFLRESGLNKLNIEDPKEAFNFMQRLTAGSREAQRVASEISVEQAGKRLTEQAVTETEAKDQPKKSRVVSKQAKELQDLLDNRALVESLKSRSTEDKFSVAQAFVEKNFGLVKDLFNVKSQAEENALKEILEEQILGEFPGSGNGKYSARNTNLFNAYDAAKEVGGAKETTYFRNVLSKRIPEIDVAIKERTGTSAELPDQTREFAPEPTTEKAKPTAKKQLPSEVKMKPEFIENLGIEVKEGQTPEQAIQEVLKTQVLDSFKDVDIKKYKDLKTPRSLAEFYAKMLGIESEAGIKALMIPNRNFPAGEKAAATRAKQFILDNLQAIHSRINTPGFKQTKVGKALLTEKGDLKPGSLKILKDIISGKNITVEGYDGKPIEFNPLENGKPVPLYRRSQPLKAVLSSYFKNNALEYLEGDAGKRARLGAKFKKVAPEINKTLKLSERRRLEKELKTIVGQLRTIAKDALPEGVELPDLSTIEGRQGYVDFLITDYFPKIMQIFGADAIYVTKSTDLSPGGNRVLFTRKDGSIAGALAEGQLGISDATKGDLVRKYGKEFVKENKELADAGLVFEQKNIKELIPEGEVDVDIEVATRQQKTKDLQRNLDSRQQHKDGFKKVLNKFKEVFDSDPKMMQGMIIHMYNANANYSFYRNLAQLIGKEIGIEKGWEEHAYQAGNFAVRTLQAMTSKNPKTWENWLEWSSEKYIQQTLGKDSVSAIDGRYKENRYSDANPAPKWLPEFKLDGVYASKSEEHPLFKKAMDEAMKTGDFSKVPDPKIRYYNEFLSLNPNLITNKGITDAKEYDVEVPKEFELNPNVYKYQGQLIYQQILTKAGILKGDNALTGTEARKLINDRLKSAKAEAKQATANNELIGKNLKIDNKIEASDAEVVINELKTADAALELSRSLNIKDGKPVPKKEKKIRVFDFDYTAAITKSKILVETSDNKTFKIDASEFAEKSAQLEKEGAKFDFSDFSKVVDGKKGPLFDVIKKIADARGTEDLFILTARPQDAAGPIKEFMKSLGIDIPLKNITGLADGKASAKGRWIMDKVAEGYNDFYFADDALKNVQAVKEVLDQADVKGKVQQAKFSKAKTFNTITNEMIEASSGIESFKTFSAAKARTLGENKGRFDWLTMASSAEDFKGLLYKMIGKGKQGEAHFEFLKTNLIDPYNRAEDSAIQAKISAANDFMALKSMYKTIPTTLKKETGVGKFTYQHALRTYMWTKQNMSIPGLSKADVTKLNKFVTDSPELQTFADQLIVSQKGKGYPEPGKDWLAGNLTTDIIGGINKVNRAEYQKTFRENVDIIFSPENLNKMEAAYGTRWRKALEDTLRRMKSGSNRPIGGSEITNKVLDWTNNSVGAVMFLNTRSALLQTISAVNFLNWGDNNPIAAGKAFANQKQFWGDFMTLMNSDYLVQRRKGLKINVSESEIADAVKDSKNKVNAAISYLLSKGFVFTRYADSFAIASGGATFYRNRIKKYVKEGMDQKLAEQKAFNDFKDVAEESQQSSDASKISMQQASGAGRIILNWANTPMQYVRIQKRAAQDLINGRGDWKTNVSKIAYYGAIQNLIFNSLQQALFAIGFGSDEDEDDPKIKARNEQKIIRVANGMVDSQLKGLGIAGAAMVATKNTILKIIEESEKKRPEYEKAAIEALSFSPAISSKYRKVVGGLKSFSWNMKEIKEKGFSLDNPAYLAGSQIFTAFTNIPLDRVVKKVNNIRGILSEQTAEWQKIALGVGYGTYDVGLPYYGGWDKPKEPTEAERKKQEVDVMKRDTNTTEQTQMLLDLGLDKKQIKALRYEDARVKKIIELQNAKVEVDGEKVEVVKPKETNEEKLKRQFDSIKAENKPEQVKTLTKFGLSKKQIRNLRYEKDRVEKILELMNK